MIVQIKADVVGLILRQGKRMVILNFKEGVGTFNEATFPIDMFEFPPKLGETFVFVFTEILQVKDSIGE